MDKGLIVGEDGKKRCWWCGDDPLYIAYHDDEWGKPVHDDRRLYEKVCLEGFQAGLSWITILKRREAFRKAFSGFDFHKVALYKEKDVLRLLTNAEIIRHRKKIESVINNAHRALEMIDEFGSLDAYFWGFAPAKHPNKLSKEMICALCEEGGKVLAKDLKKRGWSFVGPQTMYAFMQAVGIVNDHIHGCAFR